jgi:glycosyltransferase involved in cell wall biosynthesis
MISGRDIIFISSIEWDFLWQIHQEIALQFALAGNRVLYIENTGIRSPRLKDSGRIIRRLRRWIRSLFSHGVREVLPSIFVTSPLVMPPFSASASRFLNRHLLIPRLRRISQKLGFNDPLLWAYLPTDTVVDLVRLLSKPHSVVVYYCGADFTLLASNAQQCRDHETELLKLSDLVLTTCSRLAERCRRYNGKVHIIPAVVNLDEFSLIENHEAATNPGTNLFSGLPRPIIGYVGGLHRFIDHELLFEVMRRRPDWSWIFVGAITSDMNKLAAMPNAHFIGQRPHASLAQYIKEFDVCLVPYVNNASTATVVPMKVNEYLAMGKPVVSTMLPTVCDFNDRHRVLITAPNQAEEFLKAIEDALSLPNDAEMSRRRREVAELGNCKIVLKTISQWLELALHEKSSPPATIESVVVPST